MRARIGITAALAGAIAVAFTGCAAIVGPPTTQEREVDAVTAVELKTGGDLVITIGEPALAITAGENVIDRLMSEIRDGVLVLDAQGPILGGLGEIDYALSMPALTDVRIYGSGEVAVDFAGADAVRVSIDGSGEIDAQNLEADSVDAGIRGSGDIELLGHTDQMTISIDGSGEVHAFELKARTAAVTIRGSGEVELFATDSLDIDISGSGTVRHKGGAHVNSSIAGSGEVIAE